MAQQTQVGRVAERFERLLRRFPTPAAMAAAPLADVLEEWQGLGYYRRARMLHAAAAAIVERHGGRVPRQLEALLDLPGVGPYTAGAVASIAFGARAPIVDGNVARVLLRVAGVELAADAPRAQRWCWERAEALVARAGSPAILNEGLMELGATICTPAAPRCGECPLAARCEARRTGRQRLIPAAKVRSGRRVRVLHLLVGTRRGALRLRQRPEGGIWASLWEPPTLEAAAPRTAQQVAEWAAREGAAGTPRLVGAFEHLLSHRRLRLRVYRCRWSAAAEGPGGATGDLWVEPRRLAGTAISSACRRALELAGVIPRSDGARGAPAASRAPLRAAPGGGRRRPSRGS